MESHREPLATISPRHNIRCPNCGIYSSMSLPAPEYVSIMLHPCPRGDYQKSFFDCIKCNQRNIFYWHKKHREELIV